MPRGALAPPRHDNPRDEDPAVFRAHVPAGAAAGVKIIEVAGRRTPIAGRAQRAAPGDAAVPHGKGHERGQEVDGEVLPFDDRAVLADALRKVAVA